MVNKEVSRSCLQACRTGRKSRGRPRTRPSALVECPGRGMSGRLYSGCCLCDPCNKVRELQEATRSMQTTKMYLDIVTTVAPLKFSHTGALRRVSCSFQWKRLLLFLFLTMLSDSQQCIDNHVISAASLLACSYHNSFLIIPYIYSLLSVFLYIYINANQMFLKSLYIEFLSLFKCKSMK